MIAWVAVTGTRAECHGIAICHEAIVQSIRIKRIRCSMTTRDSEMVAETRRLLSDLLGVSALHCAAVRL
jgi:hypothetical protein